MNEPQNVPLIESQAESQTESEAVLRVRRKMQQEEARRMKRWGIVWLCVTAVIFVVAFVAGDIPEKWCNG